MSGESASGLLSIASRERIDRVCLNFEDAWQAAESPRIVDFLNGFTGAERAALLKELLLLEIDYLRQQGVEPVADQYLQRFPDDHPVVGEVFGFQAVDESTVLAAGQRIGRYSVERIVGQGSFGTVYLAFDTELQRKVVIKVPRLDRFGKTRDIDDFVEEARMAAKLDHPAIVSVLDVVRDDRGIPLIVMQYIEGRSLRERLNGGPMARAEALRLLTAIAEAMDYAHRRGFVHRDLEPRNILLDAEGRPHITDFGLAVHESTQRARAGESAGSLAYMSPEQLRGESHWLDGRSDVWALGVMMYELLTGRRPFVGKSFEEVAAEIFVREPKPLRQIEAEIPVELEQICLKCLAKSAAHRFATAQDLAAALSKAGGGPEALVAVDGGGALLRGGRGAIWMQGMVAGGLLGLLLCAAILAVAGIYRGSDSREQVLPRVQDIELSVWTENDEFRGRINRTESTASPLRQGDKVRLDVTMQGAAHFYVFWIGTEGDITPIFPWQAGDWTSLAGHAPRISLSLPAAGDQTWQVSAGSAGVETIVVAVSSAPLPSSVDLRRLLTGLRPQMGDRWSAPIWFEDGRPAPRQSSRQRSPEVAHPRRLDDPVVANQTLLQNKLHHHGVAIQALSFPIAGE